MFAIAEEDNYVLKFLLFINTNGRDQTLNPAQETDMVSVFAKKNTAHQSFLLFSSCVRRTKYMMPLSTLTVLQFSIVEHSHRHHLQSATATNMTLALGLTFLCLSVESILQPAGVEPAPVSSHMCSLIEYIVVVTLWYLPTIVSKISSMHMNNTLITKCSMELDHGKYEDDTSCFETENDQNVDEVSVFQDDSTPPDSVEHQDETSNSFAGEVIAFGEDDLKRMAFERELASFEKHYLESIASTSSSDNNASFEDDYDDEASIRSIQKDIEEELCDVDKLALDLEMERNIIIDTMESF